MSATICTLTDTPFYYICFKCNLKQYFKVSYKSTLEEKKELEDYQK